MATSSSTSGKGAKAASVRAVDNPASKTTSKGTVQPQRQARPAEAAASVQRTGASAATTQRTAQSSDKKPASQQDELDLAGTAATQAQTITAPSKTLHKLLIRASRPGLDIPALTASQPQARALAAPAQAIERPTKPAVRPPEAGRSEAGNRNNAQPTKDSEKDAAPRKKATGEKEHPYTKGRMSTATGLRHAVVHLAAGLVGGRLLNNMLDNKFARRGIALPEASKANPQQGARKGVETRTNLSARQQQLARISRATVQAAASATNPVNHQGPARRAADSQTERIARPEQQARIKRASLQAAPVKAKGRGR
jgi:hypothetical protein